jgi:hypothetical protein
VSCIKKYYAVSGARVFEIIIKQETMELQQINAVYFEKVIRYYTGARGKYFYITGFAPNGLVQYFFLEDTEKKKIYETPFTAVPYEDKFSKYRESRRKENRSLEDFRKKLNGENFRSSDSSSDWYRDTGPAFVEQAVQYSLWSDFAPFYVCDTSVLLMNYPQNLLERYSLDTRFFDTIPLQLRTPKERINTTLFDENREQVYYLTHATQDSAYIFSVDLRNGTDMLVRALPASAFNVRVNREYLYYLLNPDGSNEVFLFREKLRE